MIQKLENDILRTFAGISQDSEIINKINEIIEVLNFITRDTTKE